MMKLNKAILLICFLSSLSLPSIGQDEIAQDSSVTKAKKWSLAGYTKSMQGLIIVNEPSIGFSTYLSDAFLHNRLNFSYYPTENLTFKVEARNRFFFGELTASQFFSGFKDRLKEDGNDILNLQIINTGQRIILHSIIDRLYTEYTNDKWEVRLGRQRINWGINTVWNPHDIFNAYTFTDFDYEERPGSDAIRIKYYTGFASSIEIALKAFENTDEIVGGLLWKFNKKEYDFQVLTGWSNQDIVGGLGWAGAIKDVGFKGEASYFFSTSDLIDDAIAATVSMDYVFGSGTFIGTGFLYNSADNGDGTNLFSFDLSARNLYPFKYSIFQSVSHPISPLTTAGIAVIYSPISSHPLFLNPTLTYSLAQNFDIDLVGQIFLQKGEDKYRSPTQIGYLRLKWSW